MRCIFQGTVYLYKSFIFQFRNPPFGRINLNLHNIFSSPVLRCCAFYEFRFCTSTCRATVIFITKPLKLVIPCDLQLWYSWSWLYIKHQPHLSFTSGPTFNFGEALKSFTPRLDTSILLKSKFLRPLTIIGHTILWHLNWLDFVKSLIASKNIKLILTWLLKLLKFYIRFAI